jgi:hypothetical protein
LSTGGVVSGQDDLGAAVVQEFEDAFKGSSMSVSSSGPGRLSIKMGDTTFYVVKKG